MEKARQRMVVAGKTGSENINHCLQEELFSPPKNKNIMPTVSKPLLFLFLLLSCFSNAQQKFSYKADKELLKTIQQNISDADAQYKVLMKNLPSDSFPKTFYPDKNKYGFSNSGWWCSGFYPGTLLYLYEQNKDKVLHDESMRILELLKKEQFNKGTHDLGFMMYCSFGNANRLAPSAEYKEILLNSAKSLSTRFNPKVGCIKSWNSKDSTDFLVIIDNMMNLELLFWATKVSGDSSFYKIAVTHANTTMQNHFRPDYSSYHVINYNGETGGVKQKKTAQGYADESAWARGQAWGLYGYTVTYRETKDKKYLDQANHIAHFILSNPNLPADKIPYWDYNAPDIPNALRDASAAAITASALIELSGYVPAAQAKEYMQVVEIILKSLSAAPYKAAPGANGGFLIQHCVGHLPAKSEVDTPLTYADYYFVEAMKRYKALAK
ncbi:MAG: glycoside hydrolase family 88 protein [Chitinophagaceae bacterium]